MAIAPSENQAPRFRCAVTECIIERLRPQYPELAALLEAAYEDAKRDISESRRHA